MAKQTQEERDFLGLKELSLWDKINLNIVSFLAHIESIFIKPKEFSRDNVRFWLEDEWICDENEECNKQDM